ncbi:MAG: hypothetical protein ACYTFE_07070 [Planctomycetota bacterium]
MMHIRAISIIMIFAVVFVCTSPLKGEDEKYIEDLIDVQELDGDIFAIIEGRQKVFDLPSEEKILWSGSQGYMGAVLTNRRLLVISTSSKTWHEKSLREEETQEASAKLSPYLVLLVTGDRVIGFDDKNNRFFELRRPANEKFIDFAVNRYVAVVVYSRCAFGVTIGSKKFNRIRFQPNEYFETLNLKATSRFATMHTTERLVTFRESDSLWTAVDRPIR